MLAVEDGTVARAHLREHIKRCTAALVFGCFAGRDERRDKGVVEGQTRDMSARVDTESVHAHLNKRGIALNQVVIDGRVLRVQIHAVSGDLEKPAVGLVPVAMRKMMPVVMSVVIDAGRVLHLREPRRVLVIAVERSIVVRQFAAVFLRERYHAVYRRLIGRPVPIEEMAKVRLAEITGVVEHDIENDLHSPCVRLVYHRLKRDAFRLMTMIHFREIVRMVAVVVVPGRVLHDRRDPDSRKTQRFDIIHLLDQSLEISAPGRVTGVLRMVVPTLRVVRRIAVIEPRRQQEIDLLVPKIRPRREERLCRRRSSQQEREGEEKDFSHGTQFNLRCKGTTKIAHMQDFRAINFSKIEFYSIVTGMVAHSGACTQKA